jgi:hypothetical protein
MENSELNPAQVAKSGEIIKTPVKKPGDVIGFLREFNFGNSNESARKAVERFIEYMKIRGNERLLLNEPSFTDLLIDELEKAGFVKPGTISREKWTKEAEQALVIALEDFEKREKEWQDEVSKTHKDLRGLNS